MKKHDENKDLMLFSKVGRVNYNDKTLEASKQKTIGIRMWGRIDFLTHYCGWHFVWNNEAVASSIKSVQDNEDKTKKKNKGEHKLTDKRRKK